MTALPPNNALRSKPPCRREDALAVLMRLRQAGHVAYFAGGCVRDLLMGHEPADYDVATDAPPQRVRELYASTQAVGAAFGVILVRHGGSVVEVATFRSDEKYVDGRHPSGVKFATAKEDANRRDFTINGLFFDPADNRVIDLVGGQEDLRLRQIRAIGQPDQRFAEDHLRLLRAVRFAARFSFNIEPRTAAAIAEHADLLKRISPERIADELRLMLTPPTRGEAWRMLWRFGLVHVIWRFLQVRRPVDLDEARCPLMKLSPGCPTPFAMSLAAAALSYQLQAGESQADVRSLLTRSAVGQMVRSMRQGLKISNDEADGMRDSLLGIGPLLDDAMPTVAVRKRFLARPTASFSRQLMDAMAAIGMHAGRIGELRTSLLDLEASDFAPAPLITGDDLVADGMAPGPGFRVILDRVYDEQLEGRVGDRQAAMLLARQLANAAHD